MKIKEIKQLFASAVRNYVSAEEAEYFANEIVETDIRKPPRKKYSEGIIKDIQSWQNKTKGIEKKN